MPCSFLDNSIRVSGEFSVDGKSLVVLDSNHNDTDGEVNNREVIDCCTITIAPDSLPRADPVAPHDGSETKFNVGLTSQLALEFAFWIMSKFQV